MHVCNRTRRLSLLLIACLLLTAITQFSAVRANAAYKTGVYRTNYYMNFRSAPSTDAQVYEQIPPGTKVTVTQVEGEWGNITYNGRDGWMNLESSSYYVESNKPKLSEPWLIADISSWTLPSQLTWENFKKDGVTGVILRIGGRGYGGNRKMYADELFSTHYKSAKAAGLHVGAYFFSYALNKEEAMEEAQYTIDRLRYCECEMDLPVFIDIEDMDSRNLHHRAGKRACTAVVETFCSAIEQAGYYPGIYTGKYFAEGLLDTEVFENRAVWIAHYSSACGYTGSDIDMWQYTDKARISASTTKLDLSYCYVDFPALIASLKEPEPVTEPEPITEPEPTAYPPGAFGEHVPAEEWTVTKAATCTEAGARELRCKDCGEILLTEEIAPAGHAFAVTEYKVTPTLFTGGEATFVCAACKKTETREVGPLLLGDVNNDGAVTAEDARLSLRIAVALEEADEIGAVTGDVTGDGQITAEDARIILRIAVALEDSDALLRAVYPAQGADAAEEEVPATDNALPYAEEEAPMADEPLPTAPKEVPATDNALPYAAEETPIAAGETDAAV